MSSHCALMGGLIELSLVSAMFQDGDELHQTMIRLSPNIDSEVQLPSGASGRKWKAKQLKMSLLVILGHGTFGESSMMCGY